MTFSPRSSQTATTSVSNIRTATARMQFAMRASTSAESKSSSKVVVDGVGRNIISLELLDLPRRRIRLRVHLKLKLSTTVWWYDLIRRMNEWAMSREALASNGFVGSGFVGESRVELENCYVGDAALPAKEPVRRRPWCLSGGYLSSTA